MKALRSQNRQLAVNMASSIAVFALNMCLTFFLTPYVVAKLGVGTYGFIGLSNNIINYSSLLTVAVNALAGRFIAVAYHRGDMDTASRYMSSVFFANVGICVILLAIFVPMSIYLEYILNIPSESVGDVKALFLLLALSTSFGLLTGVMSVGVFIRNRMDLGNIVRLVATMLNAVLVLLLFGLLPPKLWYYGFTALVMTVYQMWWNRYYLRHFSPEIKVSFAYFHFADVLKIAASGMWNLVNRLSGMLSSGFNLLLANLFINARSMGVLSVTQAIPSLILSFVGIISGNYAPELTRVYALGDRDELKRLFFQALRINGVICAVPLGVFYAYGDIFYKLWLPTQDASWLYLLSCFGTMELIFALPQEPLWQIFTITNKLKRSSLNLLYNSIATFAVVFGAMYVVEDNALRLIVLASTKSAFGIFRCVTFLPLYGAKCLGLRRLTFYPLILKNMVNILIISAVSYLFKILFLDYTWISLFAGAAFTVLIGMLISTVLVLKSADRKYLFQRVKGVLSFSKQ